VLVEWECYKPYYRLCYRVLVLGSWFFVLGHCAHCLMGALFLGPRSWALCLLLDVHFVPASLFLGPCSWALVPRFSFLDPGSWTLCLLLAGRFFLDPRCWPPRLRVAGTGYEVRCFGGSARILRIYFFATVTSRGNGRAW
jgi:hypothetical protein